MNASQLETLHAGRYLSLVRRGHWEFATRHGATGVVGLIAVTNEAKMLLVEQLRPPLGKRVLELPAGLSGDIPGEEAESLVRAARRELLEETGYEAQEVRLLTEGPSSAGLTDEMISFFLMTGLTKTGAGGGDASENIIVHEVPLTAMPRWLEEHRHAGWAIDPKIYVGLFWIEHNSRSMGDNDRT
ncbi:MAG: NUDIX hydrolase [Planctomycetes bacterium]|nr:NUDIX hydrolase [Planctomycetota bacterium]